MAPPAITGRVTHPYQGRTFRELSLWLPEIPHDRLQFYTSPGTVFDYPNNISSQYIRRRPVHWMLFRGPFLTGKPHRLRSIKAHLGPAGQFQVLEVFCEDDPVPATLGFTDSELTSTHIIEFYTDKDEDITECTTQMDPKTNQILGITVRSIQL